MITREPTVGSLYDERCQGFVDYNVFRVYDKSTNTVYETQAIASKATGVPLRQIQIDVGTVTKRWNRIGNAFFDRKYNYYRCPENFEATGRHASKRPKTGRKAKGGKTTLPKSNDACMFDLDPLEKESET